MSDLRLSIGKTIIRRSVALGDDGAAYVTTWLPVEKDDEETGKTKYFTQPLTLSRTRDGKIGLHGPIAYLFAQLGTVADLPANVGVDVQSTPPPTSQDGMVLAAGTVETILARKEIDLSRLFADLRDAFIRFIAFPGGAESAVVADGVEMGVTVRPDDYAAYCAGYVLSTYILPAFPAIGYPWFTGLAGSGKSTAAHVIARTACLSLMASASSTLASLRGHADAGGTLIVDNFDTVNNKDDNTRYLRSFCELGYQHGASITLQVPNPAGRGWITERANVYANRVFTAVMDPPDALDSRSIKVLMLRTDDNRKAALSPWDDTNWQTRPHDLVQRCWHFALVQLDRAATTARAVTSEGTGLTNRDLQVWRPVLTVARLVDTANGDTAVWDAVLRLARHLLRQRAEDDGSREAYVTRALIAIVDDGRRTTTTKEALAKVKRLYAQESGETEMETDGSDSAPFGLENAKKLGYLFKRMGIPKLPRTNKGNIYDLSETVITRLRALYLPHEVMTAPYQTTPSAQTARLSAQNGAECDICAESVEMGVTVAETERIDIWMLDAFPDATIPLPIERARQQIAQYRNDFPMIPETKMPTVLRGWLKRDGFTPDEIEAALASTSEPLARSAD